MLGIITALLSLQGVALGACAAGAGLRSWWRRTGEDDSFDVISPRKRLYKHGLVMVENIVHHKPTGTYTTCICCQLIKRRDHVTASTKEELQAKIEKTVATLSILVDEHNQRARA